MSQQNEFPEVSEFLQKMQIRKSVFGYDKEDVMLKMQQLNRLYQERMLMVKGQLEQERGKAKEEMDRIRAQAEEEAAQIRALAQADAEELRRQMETDKEALVEQIRKEEQEKLLVVMKEKRAERGKELRMLGEELKRVTEQLQNLRGHAEQMSAELENV